MSKRIFPSALLLFLLVNRTAWGWGDLGHQTIAEIANRHLSEAGKHFVFQMLGAAPLSTASVFADIVRPDARFDPFIPYHLIDIPPGLTPKTLTAKQRLKRDAHVVLSQFPEAILSKKTDQNQKRLLFQYLVHVVGDIHMPLHVGNGLDRGGSLCDVKWREVRSGRLIEVNLHSVWDDRIFDYVVEDFYVANNHRRMERRRISHFEFADAILKQFEKEPEEKKKEMKAAIHTRYVEWYEEALALHHQVYPDSEPNTKPESRYYCKVNDKSQPNHAALGVYDPTKIPIIQEDYARKSLIVAKWQILKAGYRLGKIINDMAAKSSPAKFEKNQHEKLLNAVLLSNDEGKGD